MVPRTCPGLGDALKSATGAGGGVIRFGSGQYWTCAVALELSGIVCPPKMTDSNGVMSVKLPVTSTVTVLPACPGHPGTLHFMSMLLSAIETDESFASSWTRQITRLVAVLQG